MKQERQRIAVVGAGVAGVVSAHILSRVHDVTLFERSTRLGGHTYTVKVPEGVDADTPVDMGFIVLNDKTYPLLHRFLAQLEVPVRFADMSFSVYCKRSGLQYASADLNGVFADRRNLLSPGFLKMLLEIRRFWQVGAAALAAPEGLERYSISQFLAVHGFSKVLLEDYIIPMGAAIWSSPSQGMADFPADTCLGFFRNHGLLGYFDQPRWQTIPGGSSQYLRAFEKRFPGIIQKNASVASIRRVKAPGEGVVLRDQTGAEEQFHQVVIAVHASEVLGLLADPTDQERELFSAWRYQKNITVLHTDTSFLPPLKRAWASWNYQREVSESPTEPISITYDLTRLQGLATKNRYLVTLNPRREIAPNAVIHRVEFDHPVYTHQAVATQVPIGALAGRNKTWFCGSYLGYGFHEDGVRSAVHVARGFGLEL